jgi:hypothetical protein
MTGSATPVIVGALLFLCVAVAVVLAAGFYGWRWARRRLLVARAAWRGIERAWMATRTGRTVLGGWHHLTGTTAVAPAGDVRTAPPAELRGQLWQGIGDADRAVRDAVAAGAPVGDLPSLSRRLRSTADALDGLLVAAGDGEHLVGVRRQVADVLSTASAIRSAATAATVAVVSDATEVRLRHLVADTDREVHSLATGVDRSRLTR